MTEPLTEAQKQFANDNIPLVHSLAKLYRAQWSYVEYDEYMSASYMALVQATRIFDPSRGFKFSALLSRCLISEWNNVAAQRHYLRIPRDYGPGHSHDESEGFPEARALARRTKREGRINRDGVDLLAMTPAPEDSDPWAYELTSQLPPKSREIAERNLIQGETLEAVRPSLEIGWIRYRSLRGKTKQILGRLIRNGDLLVDAS